MKFTVFFFFLVFLSGCVDTKETDSFTDNPPEKSDVSTDSLMIHKTDSTSKKSIKDSIIIRNKKVGEIKTPSLNYNVKWVDFSTPEEKIIDTIVDLEYLKNNLDTFYEFNYPLVAIFERKGDTLLAQNDSIEVRIIIGKVDTTEHDIISRNGEQYIVSSNDKTYWGTDGYLPSTEIEEMHLFYKDKKTVLNKDFYNDLYEPDNTGKVFLTPNNEVLISMFNSDGSGAYTLMLFISLNGQIQNRVVGYGF